MKALERLTRRQALSSCTRSTAVYPVFLPLLVIRLRKPSLPNLSLQLPLTQLHLHVLTDMQMYMCSIMQRKMLSARLVGNVQRCFLYNSLPLWLWVCSYFVLSRHVFFLYSFFQTSYFCTWYPDFWLKQAMGLQPVIISVVKLLTIIHQGNKLTDNHYSCMT